MPPNFFNIQLKVFYDLPSLSTLVPPRSYIPASWTPDPGFLIENTWDGKKLGHLKLRGGTKLDKNGKLQISLGGLL